MDRGFKACSLLPSFFLMLCAHPAFAHDSSGGKRIEEILSHVEFSGGVDPALDPALYLWENQNYEQLQIKKITSDTLFAWDDFHKQEALNGLRRILTEMPLDVAQTEVESLTLSNSDVVCSSVKARTVLQELKNREPRMKMTEGYNDRPEPFKNLKKYYDGCIRDAGSWHADTAEILIAGGLLAFSETPDYFPETIIHEFTHAWHSEHYNEALPFFKLRFMNNSKKWTAIGRAHARWVDKHPTSESSEIDKVEFAEYGLLKLPKDIDCSQPLDAVETQYCKHMRLDPKFIMYPMFSFQEYLAVLAELMWKRPERAKSSYSPEEIAWVNHHIFADRLAWPHELGRSSMRASKVDLTANREKITRFLNLQVIPSVDWLNKR